MANWKSFFINYGASIIGTILAIAISIMNSANSGQAVSDSQVIIAFATLILVQISITLNRLIQPISEIRAFTETKAVTEPVRENSFHSRFQNDVNKANQRVFVTYFNNQNPLEHNNPDVREYYEQMSEKVKEKQRDGVIFRRIVRGIPQTKEWIEYLIETHEGDNNYSLACLLDEEPNSGLKAHVPVQLIDQNIVYFVAVGEQLEEGSPRDIYIRSEELNTQWDRYYSRIWADSCTLIRAGDVQDDNLAKFRNHINDLEDGE